MGDSESQGGFAGSWRTNEEEGATGKFTRLDKVHDHTTGLGRDPTDLFFTLNGMRRGESYLSSVCLADETGGIGGGVTFLGETKTFYVRMDGYAG